MVSVTDPATRRSGWAIAQGPPCLRVDVEPWGLVRLVGELDLFTAQLLERALEPCLLSGRPLRLDLSGLDFIDAAGVRELVKVRERSNGSVRVVSASRIVVRVLGLTGLSAQFGIAPASDPTVVRGAPERAGSSGGPESR